jgi:hypothetical protein
VIARALATPIVSALQAIIDAGCRVRAATAATAQLAQVEAISFDHNRRRFGSVMGGDGNPGPD